MTEALTRLSAALADRYAIERELGQGGMATVYLAEDLKHRRKVAVKVLRPQIAATLGAERFSREIEVAARLQHPHILPLLDSGEADGFFYYVMPFVEGESLRERLARQGELPVHEALRVLGEIVDALAYAHAHGVVHRDIKPDNIMLSGRHALVTDFGVAKAVSEATGSQQLTTAGVALGTPAYMAPEQAAADPHLDHRVDIYAIGALAYELLTGRPPFTGRTPQEILAAHVTTAPDPVDRHRPGLSTGLTQVIMRCLAKRPADRWQTADELLIQLEPLVTPSGGMTPTQTQPIIVGPPRQLPRWAAWAGAGALVAGGALALSLAQRPQAPLVIGRRTAIAVSPALEQMPNLSPDGRMVSWTTESETGGELDIQQVEGGTPVRLTDGMPGWQALGLLSPDGNRLLFLSARGLEIMPALGGQARVVAEGNVAQGGLLWGAWSPDGQEIVYPGKDTLFIRRLDASDRRVVAVGTEIHSPAWSPDGEWIAFVEGNPGFYVNGNIASSAIRVVRASGGQPVAVTGHDAVNLRPIWVPGRRSLLFISDRDGGRDIYEVALKSSGKPAGAPMRITTGLSPEWISLSADGSRIAWSVYTEASNVWSLPVSPRDSLPLSQARPVTSGTQKVESWDVSPDGEWLYYDSDRSGNMDIWRQPLAGGAPEQVTTDPAPEFLPNVSPDGKEVAFHSIRNGNRDIFVIPAAGGTTVQVSPGPGDDRAAIWSPDGHALMWSDRLTASDSTLLLARRKPDGSWGAPKRLKVGRLPQVSQPWWVSGGAEIAFTDSAGRMHLLNPETEVDRPTGLELPAGAFTVWSQDERTIYAALADSLGGMRILAYPASGGRPRVLAYADNPRTQAYGFGMIVHGDRFYFPFGERRSDVWVGEVSRP